MLADLMAGAALKRKLVFPVGLANDFHRGVIQLEAENIVADKNLFGHVNFEVAPLPDQVFSFRAQILACLTVSEV
jgi:hypothetical protein